MNEPESSPRKRDRDNEKKRQEQSRRQLHFAVSYLITSLIALWLFQVFVLTPLTRKTEIPYSEFKSKLAGKILIGSSSSLVVNPANTSAFLLAGYLGVKG